MIYLSELSSDTMLYISCNNYADTAVMSKEEFLHSDYFLNGENVKVYIADKETIKFDLWDVIENLGEEAYEDWDLDVYNEIKDNPITAEFLKLITATFDNHPVYYDGQMVMVNIHKEASENE